MRYTIFSLAMLSLLFVSACKSRSPEDVAEAKEREQWQQQVEQLEREETRRLREKGQLDLDQQEDANRLFIMARYEYEQGKYEKALRLYAVLSSRYGDSDKRAGAQSHLAVGDCLMKLKQYRNASFAYHAAVTGYPEESKEHLGHIRLGDAYTAAGNHDRAFRYYYLARILYRDAAEEVGIAEKIKKARESHLKQLAAKD